MAGAGDAGRGSWRRFAPSPAALPRAQIFGRRCPNVSPCRRAKIRALSQPVAYPKETLNQDQIIKPNPGKLPSQQAPPMTQQPGRMGPGGGMGAGGGMP